MFWFFATAALVHKLKLSKPLKAAIAATLMVSYDIFFRAGGSAFRFFGHGLAAPYRYKIMSPGGLLLFLMLLGAFTYVKNLRNRLAIYVILIQTLFFILLIFDQNLSIR